METKELRRLLEMAAKAAGYSVLDQQYEDGGLLVLDDKKAMRFHPWADDGDALRLAVKLGISIFPPKVPKQDGDFSVAALQDSEDRERDDWFQEMVGSGDEITATRRAIVRAAAAIGEAMQ